MNLRQALQAAAIQISKSELPSSETGRIIDNLLNDTSIRDCPHHGDDGCGLIDVCENHPYGGAEPF